MSKVKTGFTHESQAANSTEWYTPPSIFQGLGCTFDIDTCAPEGGLPWIPANKFLRGRVKFVDGNGDSGNSGAGNGSMLVAYGEEAKRVLEKCSLKGALWYPTKE